MAPLGLRHALVAASAASLLVLPAVANAASVPPTSSGSAANPTPLSGTVQGHLTGNSGGAYDYFQFMYPGDGSTVTLNLTTTDATPLNIGAAGLNVYQDGVLLTTSSANGPFAADAIFTSNTRGPIVVQLFDYDPTSSFNFSLSSTGLATQPAATSTATTATATTAPATSAKPSSTTSSTLELNGGSVSGNLAANSGGSFATYTLNYPGDGSAETLTLTTDNSTPLATGAAGINIYQNGVLLTTSSQSGPFAADAIFTSNTGGPVVVQVFNYDPAIAISYTLTTAH